MVGPASLRKASCKEITGGPQILGRIPPLIKVRRRFELFLLLFASTVRPGCSVPPPLHRTTPTHNPLRALDLHHCRPGDQQRLRTASASPGPSHPTPHSALIETEQARSRMGIRALEREGAPPRAHKALPGGPRGCPGEATGQQSRGT